MGGKNKIIAGCIILILIISVFYFVLNLENGDECIKTIVIDEDKSIIDDDIPKDNNDDEEEYTHTVFIEETSDTGCIPCTKIAQILDDLYKTGDYDFYYVSLVEDKSDIAQKRIKEEYNVFGFPTTFIDGGYKVFFAGGFSKSDFINEIEKAKKRNAPKIKINITAEYDEKSTDLITTVFLENNESYDYTGRLRIYLTEIISRWDQANSEPYHFALVDFIINKDIEIPANGNASFEDKRKISEFALSDLEPEELMAIGVVFNSKSFKKDSFPISDSKGEFDAYYADATSATLIVPGGNLPPQAKIIHPVTGKIHIYGKPYKETPLKNTILTGNTPVIAEVKDDSTISKVEFYIDGKLVFTDEEEPYEYELEKAKIFGRIYFSINHEIKIIAYDSEGKTDDAAVQVITLFRMQI